MRVLVACEFSGTVRDAFTQLGHDAWSCDLLPTESPGNHIQGNVLDILDAGWDLMVAHPPCTYLAKSGVQHLWRGRKRENGRNEERWIALEESTSLFLALLNCKTIPRIAVENPVPHSYAGLPPYSQIVQPYHFGEAQQKMTCLWLRNLPLLLPTNVVGKGERYFTKEGRSNGSKWYQLPPGKDRWKHRSKTFEGIAQAMATQWGSKEIRPAQQRMFA
jgi:hypothetical protein